MECSRSCCFWELGTDFLTDPYVYFSLPSLFPPQVSDVYSVQSLAIKQKISGRLNPWAFSLSEMFWTKTLIRLGGKILCSLQLWPSSWVSSQYQWRWVLQKWLINMIYSLTTTLVSRCSKPFFFFYHPFSQMCLLKELNTNKIVFCNLYIKFRQTDLNAYWNKQSQESRKTPCFRQRCGALLQGIMGASPVRIGSHPVSWAHTHFFKCVIVFKLLVVRK